MEHCEKRRCWYNNSERISDFGMHDQTDLFDLLPIHLTIRNVLTQPQAYLYAIIQSYPWLLNMQKLFCSQDSSSKRGNGNPIASGYFVFSLCAVLSRSGLFFGKPAVRESVDSLSEVKHVLRNIFRYEHAFLNFRSGDAFDDI